MTGMSQQEGRGVLWLGIGSIAACLFTLTSGDNLRLIEIRTGAVVLLVVLGIAAIVAGTMRNALIALVTGVVYLIAAVLGVAQLASSSQLLPGNASTYALFLGLGVGLVAIGLTALRGPAPEVAA
jgi:hypothetical protein